MGSTISAIIRIRNLTYSNITTILIYDFDTFDFGSCRPDKVFNGKSVPSKSCIEKSIDFSTISSNCPFSIKFVYDNGTEDIFRINFKSILENDKNNLKYLRQTHRVNLKKTGPRVLEIIIENTEEQIENNKAEKLLCDARKLMDLGKFNEASIKFLEASQKANDENTIKHLHKATKLFKKIKEEADDDRKAKNLNNEGLTLMKNFQISEAINKFQEALNFANNLETQNLIEDNLKIAQEASNDQLAERLYEDGLRLVAISNIDGALLKFEEALKITKDPNLVKSINCVKSDCLRIQAEEVLEKAWMLDDEDSEAQSAIYHFSKSKFLFQEANTLQSRTELEEKIFIIECKIQGEKFYHSGLHLENSMKSDAVNLFKQSLEKFEEGRAKSDKFTKSLEKVSNRLISLAL